MLNRHFKSIRQPNGLINKRWQNKWLTPETHTHTHTAYTIFYTKINHWWVKELWLFSLHLNFNLQWFIFLISSASKWGHFHVLQIECELLQNFWKVTWQYVSNISKISIISDSNFMAKIDVLKYLISFRKFFIIIW